MKAKNIFLILVLAIVAYGFTRSYFHSPEELLLGQWSERTWKYERVPAKGHLESCPEDELTSATKSYIGKGLLLHENERWEFLPSGKLVILSQQDALEEYKWCLKGKGDILIIKDSANKVIEHYKITHIDTDSLSLNFELDIQVKGLASLTFKKNKR